MGELHKLIEQLSLDWSEPRSATHADRPTAVPFVCRFSLPVDCLDVAKANNTVALPADALEFWQCANGGSLFEDQLYGQWGLRLLSVAASMDATERFAANRTPDFLKGDLVVGEFLGDSDLLILRCDPASVDYGTVIVALPLDARSDWDLVASSFAAFLIAYANSHGEKLWRKTPLARSVQR